MAPRLSGQNCKVFKFSLSLNSQKRLKYKQNNTKYRGLTWKPRSHVRISNVAYCEWSRKITPLSKLTRASLLVKWKLTAKAELNCEIYKSWRKCWKNRESFCDQRNPVSRKLGSCLEYCRSWKRRSENLSCIRFDFWMKGALVTLEICVLCGWVMILKSVWHRVRSFGVIWIKTSDPRSVWIMVYQRNRWIQTDLGSLILIQITPKERSHSVGDT